MTSVFVETSSRIDDFDANVQTRGIRTDDWFYPKIQRDDIGETTSYDSNATTKKSATTMPPDAQKISEPIRKNNFAIRLPNDQVKLIQQWECVISRVNAECVECEMHDLTDETQPVEIAEVYLEEFNIFDLPLLCEGAVFYWSIGHETKTTGQVRRYSELRVRRMPQLGSLKKREISQRAKQISELFPNNPASSAAATH